MKNVLKLNSIKQINNTAVIIIGIILIFFAGCKNEIINPVLPKDYLAYGNVVKKGLIAYYPFDGNAKDYSGNGYDGILHGTSDTVGRFGQQEGALKFDGVDDYIEIPNFINVNDDSGTICFWVRTPDTFVENGEAAVISKIDTVGLGYVLSLFNSADFWFNYKEYKNQSRMDEENMFTNSWEYGKYAFIAVTFTNNTITYYFQGYWTAQDSIVQGAVFKFNDNNQPLFIGKSLISHYKFFEGDIDDLLIYDRALSKDEILKLYNWQ